MTFSHREDLTPHSLSYQGRLLSFEKFSGWPCRESVSLTILYGTAPSPTRTLSGWWATLLASCATSLWGVDRRPLLSPMLLMYKLVTENRDELLREGFIIHFPTPFIFLSSRPRSLSD